MTITFVIPHGSLKAFILPILNDGGNTSTPEQSNEIYPNTNLLVEAPERSVEKLQNPPTGTLVVAEPPSKATTVQVQIPNETLVKVETREIEAPLANSNVNGLITSPLVHEIDATDQDEHMNFVSNFFKRVASYFDMGSKQKKQNDENKGSELIVPENVAKDLIGTSVPNYENLFSLTEEPVMNVQPVLWVTPRSGSKTLKEVLTYCFGLVISCDAALSHEIGSTLEIFSTPDNSGHFVNVNTETRKGLLRAHNIGIVDSELVQVVATPFIADASSLFAHKTRTGRIFALLRHPVDQAHSDFLFRKDLPSHHPDYIPPELTLSQFVESERLITNPLARALLNMNQDTLLTKGHAFIAKKLLQERVLVGLLEAFDESIHRFEKYFGWKLQDPLCVTNFKAVRDHRQDHQHVPESSNEWKILSDRNFVDMELYDVGKNLFESQNGLTSINI